jgi:hypothetical protein
VTIRKEFVVPPGSVAARATTARTPVSRETKGWNKLLSDIFQVLNDTTLLPAVFILDDGLNREASLAPGFDTTGQRADSYHASS